MVVFHGAQAGCLDALETAKAIIIGVDDFNLLHLFAYRSWLKPLLRLGSGARVAANQGVAAA